VSPINGGRPPLVERAGTHRGPAGNNADVTTRRPVLVLLVAALVGAPLAYAAWNELALHRGRHVLLRVQPVDPIDPFRGEYVALSYGVSRVAVPRPVRVGETVYVPLHRSGGAWTGTRAATRRPEHGPFLRGTVDDAWDGQALVRYGIERFYVQEGTARRYEAAIETRRLYGDVVVAHDGKARLAKLVVRR
jgi:hypothetical protein